MIYVYLKKNIALKNILPNNYTSILLALKIIGLKIFYMDLCL